MSNLRINVVWLLNTAFLDILNKADISRTRRFQSLKFCQVYIYIYREYICIYICFVGNVD